MQQRVLRRLRVAAIESMGGQLFIGRMGVNVGAELVVHVQNGCEGREISEKFACLIPDLPERNLPTFRKKSSSRPSGPHMSCICSDALVVRLIAVRTQCERT